jgi:hypothetical protein
MAELDRGVLRTLVGVMDHAARSPRHQCHIERIEHQLSGKHRRHRPADDTTAIRIEHHREIQKARPGRNIDDVGNPQQIRRCRGEVALDQIRCLAAIALDRGGDEPAPDHPGKPGLRHQPRDALAASANALGRKLGMNTRHTVSPPRGRVRRTDLPDQRIVCLSPPRRLSLHPCIAAAGGDSQQRAHGGNRI